MLAELEHLDDYIKKSDDKYITSFGCTQFVNYRLTSAKKPAIIHGEGSTYKPQRGDLIFFDGSDDGYSGHVGIVIEYTDEGMVNYWNGNVTMNGVDVVKRSSISLPIPYPKPPYESGQADVYAIAQMGYNQTGFESDIPDRPLHWKPAPDSAARTTGGSDVLWFKTNLYIIMDVGKDATSKMTEDDVAIVKQFQALYGDNMGIASRDGFVDRSTVMALKAIIDDSDMYTVTFVNVFGSKVISQKKVLEGGYVIGAMPQPTRAGYRFAGWREWFGNGKLYTATDICPSNLTLYST